MPEKFNAHARRFNAVYAQLASMCAFALEAAEPYGFDSKALYQIELAMDEACSNIIDHAYQGEGKGHIDILVEQWSHQLVLILEDQGRAFEPDKVAQPDLVSPLEERAERGLGVYTMRKVMDAVNFEFPAPGVNRLTMVKKGTFKQ